MPYLPSELWLQILTYTTNPQHLWRSLRPTNRQLRDCVDQHFRTTLLPTIKVELTFGLPCYDARNPLRGSAIFAFSHLHGNAEGESERVVCALVGVKPEHYMEQLLVRWDRLKESCGGCLAGSLEWSLALGGGDGEGRREGEVKLRDPVAFSNHEKTVDGSAVGFEWRGSLGSFFSMIR